MAFVQHLSLDHWSGMSCQSLEVAYPRMQQIVADMARLDARHHTLLSLAGEGATLLIGGGNGQYVVVHFDDDDASRTLVDRSRDGGAIVPLTVGGQESDFPSRQVVDEALALRAMAAFFVDGRPDAGLDWEQD